MAISIERLDSAPGDAQPKDLSLARSRFTLHRWPPRT